MSALNQIGIIEKAGQLYQNDHFIYLGLIYGLYSKINFETETISAARTTI